LALLLGLLAATFPLGGLAEAASPSPSAADASSSSSLQLSVVGWHPFPDPSVPGHEGDPFGFPAPNATQDWMAAYYGAYYYPTARFDGVLAESNLADSNPQNFFDTYQADVVSRLAVPSPIAITIDGGLDGLEANGTLRLETETNLTAEHLVLRAAVVEDEVPFSGSNGVATHRMVARLQFPDRDVHWVANGSAWAFAVSYRFVVGNGTDGKPWRSDFLGVVAWVQNVGEAGTSRFEPREVLQSATHFFRDKAPTVQTTRAVLLEMYSATWCTACVQGDGATDLLLQEYGTAALLEKPPVWTYLRVPAPEAAASAVVLAAPLAWVFLRRSAP
jgi:hypothetical protein